MLQKRTGALPPIGALPPKIGHKTFCFCFVSFLHSGSYLLEAHRVDKPLF